MLRTYSWSNRVLVHDLRHCRCVPTSLADTLDVVVQVLNYGQSVFEGMKAQRSAKNRIVLFRPTENAARMSNGADRLSMAPVPSDMFVGAVQQLVRDNQDYVPPQVCFIIILYTIKIITMIANCMLARRC